MQQALASIPAKAVTLVDLTKDANAIIRSEETVFTVNSIGSGVTKYKATITILNENGKHHAKLYVPYDKLSKVDNITGTSYDKSGKKIKTLKNKDIIDISSVSDFSLFEDNRVKIANLTYTIYPYTVEFEYQVTTKNMLFYPLWRPQSEEDLSVEKALLRVEVPKGMKLRYRENNLQEKVTQESTPTYDVYLWQVKDLAPVVEEPYGPSLAELVPEVRTAPTYFEVEGYQGNMETWQSYGQWVNKLNTGRDVLPEATRQKLQEMVVGATSPEEKAKKLYDYLQGKTRYVSIQLGIGGWQPFEASFVDSKGYGDCKALTNYTQSMLKAVGVDSYQALIRAGDGATDVITDFPSSQFNHVILCVPLPKDTLWLECTSQTTAAGYSGSFTGGRHALLITPDGGKLVKTQFYKAEDNAQKRNIKVQLDEAGNGTATVTTVYTGEQQESRSQAIHSLKPDDQKKWLYQQIKVPSYEILSYGFEEQKMRLPVVTEKLELSLRQCATISGKRMFLSPNLMSKWTYIPPQPEKRKTDVVRNMAFFDSDSVVFELPVGYTLEYQPQDVVHKSEFGEYKATIKVNGPEVTYIRTMQMYDGRFSSESYARLVEFLNNVVKADGDKVVFVKNIN
ncbi:DUF3857 domain-containing protein [Pontibacter silvestris]|uniref:DUF3857 domain-containing protein n=1 Tax=Pontibacter silvestris TaxID=2305183 RepID=A0ABW4WX89_9BACT|nr:DUF3857 and transglutaminase domain-containing protein [Pontibacter silvestris]MCC9136709.1 DUF3857 and transglutaminase domain-containing protein [Pontibacter silvestris]